LKTRFKKKKALEGQKVYMSTGASAKTECRVAGNKR